MATILSRFGMLLLCTIGIVLFSSLVNPIPCAAQWECPKCHTMIIDTALGQPCPLCGAVDSRQVPPPARMEVAPVLREAQREKATNCSGFLKEVARRLQLPTEFVPQKPADDIIEHISRSDSGWIKIGRGVEFAPEAIRRAKEGYLVVAVLKAVEHDPWRRNKDTGQMVYRPYTNGHVSVVIPEVGRDGYPKVVSGSTIADGRSDGSKAVRGVWREIDAPKVAYYRTPDTYPELLKR